MKNKDETYISNVINDEEFNEFLEAKTFKEKIQILTIHSENNQKNVEFRRKKKMNEIKLNNNVMMPQVGIGTFLLEPNDAYNSVFNALKMGYRLIDTANAYRNEKAVGRAIKDSGIVRKDIFVSTKLWPSEYENENAVNETLQRLNLDYIDLLFLHQPTKNWRYGYEALIKAYKERKIRSIGVSNFEGEYISDLLKEYDIVPQVMLMYGKEASNRKQ